MITIVDYDAGNLRSVERACAAVGLPSLITQDPDRVAQADKIIFPGVGAAPHAMDVLKATGLGEALRSAFKKGTPILGICLGTQIVLESSEEGNVPCLGLVPGKTIRFQLQDSSLKIPHMGWNGIEIRRSHPLLDGVQNGDEFYFVHSYYPSPANEADIVAICEYESPFCCALGRDNLFATQFHPEKSGRFGLELLQRFAGWDGTI